MGVYDIKQPSKFNLVNVTVFSALFALGYLGWWYIPQWWPMFQITAIMSGIANDAYREFNDERLMTKMLKEVKRTGLPLTEDNFELIREPYEADELAGLTSYQSKVAQDRGKFMTVRFEYVSKSKWPLTDKPSEVHFTKEIRTDLKIIRY